MADFYSEPKVATVVQQYPKSAQQIYFQFKQIILEVIEADDKLPQVTETLKWNEPSFVCKTGSTFRLGWSAKRPHQFGVYFNCNSKLIESFRVVFGDIFHFEGNRAIVFDVQTTELPDELKTCFHTALHYHQFKQQPLLGL